MPTVSNRIGNKGGRHRAYLGKGCGKRPDSYPLINYEYAFVSDQQPNPQVAAAISNFLLWCISPQGGSAANFLDPVHFIALPTSIRARSEIQIADIQ